MVLPRHLPTDRAGSSHAQHVRLAACHGGRLRTNPELLGHRTFAMTLRPTHLSRAQEGQEEKRSCTLLGDPASRVGGAVAESSRHAKSFFIDFVTAFDVAFDP